MTVFKYNIWFDGDEDKQERYVVAETEEEAERKLLAYRDQLIKDGFDSFTYAGAWVELSNVII